MKINSFIFSLETLIKDTTIQKGTVTNNSIVHNNEFNRLRNQIEFQNTLLDFATELLKLDTSEDIVWAITENIIDKLGFFDCVIYLICPKKNLLIQRSAYGPKNPAPKQILNPLTLKIGQGVVGKVAETGIPVIIKDTRKEQSHISDAGSGFSEIAVPIIVGDKVLGVIDSEHPQANFYSEEHLEYLTQVATLSAVTLHNALTKESLEKQKENLQVEISKRTAKLEATMADLKRSNDDLANFAHVISHDLKQPLRTINSFINLIKNKELSLSEKSKEYFEFVSDGTIRIQKVIDGLLKFSKVFNPNQLETEFDLNMVMANVRKNLAFQIEESKAEIRVDKMPSISGYESLINLLFQNIISNSIKFKQKNIAPKIDISYKEDDQYVYITIKDNGVGIEFDHKQKAFEIFQRLHGEKEYEGTGMGLSFCQKIVERHKGEIWLESKGLNKGTTVNFCLLKTSSEIQ